MNYNLAPEYQWPVQINENEFVVRWLHAHAAKHGVDPARIALENPKPQWIAILTGRWFFETMDGHRIEMGPGELMMGEDQNTKERDGRKGHLSGTVGDEPCTMIVTWLEVTPTVNKPGRFK